MSKKPDPTIQIPHYAADEDPPVADGPTSRMRTEALSAEENRGRRAPDHGSGVVEGSGASAGGGGAPENYDEEDMAGGRTPS